jgi:hypothetical protein
VQTPPTAYDVDINDVSNDLDNALADLEPARPPKVVLPFFPETLGRRRFVPTNSPTLVNLLRTVVRKELRTLGFASPPAPAANRASPFRSGKRSFDSISRGSGFGGMHRSFGGSSNRSGDNLTFTFESLFPAIARGLRSTVRK